MYLKILNLPHMFWNYTDWLQKKWGISVFLTFCSSILLVVSSYGLIVTFSFFMRVTFMYRKHHIVCRIKLEDAAVIAAWKCTMTWGTADGFTRLLTYGPNISTVLGQPQVERRAHRLTVGTLRRDWGHWKRQRAKVQVHKHTGTKRTSSSRRTHRLGLGADSSISVQMRSACLHKHHSSPTSLSLYVESTSL